MPRLDDPLHDAEIGSRDSTLDTTRIDDVRISAVRPLISPALLLDELPVPPAVQTLVEKSRLAIADILHGRDDRLIVVTGPCSIHDHGQAMAYAQHLKALQPKVEQDLLLVMRVYFEKPRTTVGWKGYINDPHLDGSDDMATGLTLSRELMREMLRLGLPIATELLQPMAAGYFDDLLSWVAIGARTTESQIHREMASGLNMPVGFKNGTDGGVAVASDAMRSAAHPHRHFGVDSQGHPAIIQTPGNPDTHLVLRGGHRGPNFDRQSVAQVQTDLDKLKIPARIMVDCSHANSSKNPLRQPAVFDDVLEQRLQGNTALIGMMLESHLFEGCQPLSPSLQYGVSITDGCLGWESTETLLRVAAERLRDQPAIRQPA